MDEWGARTRGWVVLLVARGQRVGGSGGHPPLAHPRPWPIPGGGGGPPFSHCLERLAYCC
jgi:hypothetical protein